MGSHIHTVIGVSRGRWYLCNGDAGLSSGLERDIFFPEDSKSFDFERDGAASSGSGVTFSGTF